MKVTKMRIKGSVPSTDQVLAIVKDLNNKFDKAGFVTVVSFGETRSSLKIGLWMKTFTLNLSKHDRNLQCNPFAKKLTNLPTWDQRVEFNNIVNSVLNKFKVSANIKSGPYIIRQGLEVMTENDWHDQKPGWIRSNETNGYFIESINEKEYLEERRIERNRLAAHKRNMTKQVANIAQTPTLRLV